MKIRKNQLADFIVVVIALLPILSIYRFNGFSLDIATIALILIAVLVILSLLLRWVKVKNCNFIVLFSMLFLIGCIEYTSQWGQSFTEFITTWIHLAIMAVIIDFVPELQENIQVFQKWIIRISIVASLALILQMIASVLFNVQIFFYLDLPFLRIHYIKSTQTVHDLIMLHEQLYSAGIWRPTSFFCEPAHFAEFMLLPLVISIFSDLEKHFRIFCMTLFTVAVFFSQSANGIIIAILVWGIYIIKCARGRFNTKQMIGFVLITVVSIAILTASGVVQKAFERVATVAIRDHGTTGNGRLLQGLAVFSRLKPYEKLFGVGFGNISAYLTENNIVTQFIGELGNAYMNGFSEVLVSGGIVGLVLYFVVWFRILFENRDMLSRTALFVISILMCTEALFFSPTLIYYLVFVRIPKLENCKRLGDIRKTRKSSISSFINCDERCTDKM